MMKYLKDIEVLNVREYFDNAQNTEKFIISLTECYKNPSDIFQRATSINDTVFVLTDPTQVKQIIGYLFYSDRSSVPISINNILTKCIYNGYALINNRYRKTGALKKLLLFATDHYCNKYSDHYQKILFYAVTSNPFALRGYYNVFETARPSLDGPITESDLSIAEYLKNQLYVDTKRNEHPFILKTNLPQRYNEDMRETFTQSVLNEVKFLDHLNVNESNGDRFLFYWTNLTLSAAPDF